MSGRAVGTRIGRAKRSAVRNARAAFMRCLFGSRWIPTLKERLGDDDDVPRRQRDVRVRLGVPLDRSDVHTQPYLLVGFASSIPSSSIPSVNRVLSNEGDPGWRGKLREAPGKGDELHDRQRLGPSVGAGLGDLAHNKD